MKNLRQEKCLRDHEPYLGDLRQLRVGSSPAGSIKSANCPLCRPHGAAEGRGMDPATSGACHIGSNFACPDDYRENCLAYMRVALAYSALALDSWSPWRTRAVADGNGSLLVTGSRRNRLNRLLVTGVTMIKRLRVSSSKRNLPKGHESQTLDSGPRPSHPSALAPVIPHRKSRSDS
jgi:hypothetical protein